MDIKIKEVLEDYKKRLVNFSARNKTLKRNKINLKDSFDLVKNNDEFLEKIKISFYKDDNTKIQILDILSGVTLSAKMKKEIRENYIKYADRTFIKNFFTKEELKNLKSKNIENEKLVSKIIKEIERYETDKLVEKKYELNRKFSRLNDTIISGEKETGLYEMYVGFPFIEGKLNDDKPVRAPLFLFPCKIYKKDEKWFFENLNDEKIYLNKPFLMAYRESIGIKNSEFELEEFDELKEFFSIEKEIKNNMMFNQHCIEWINKNLSNINCEAFTNEEIEYKDYTMESYKEYRKGQLELKNYAILGQFKLGDSSIFKDLDELIKKEKYPDSIKELLFIDNEIVENTEERNKKDELANIDENNCNFVTELDYSQEKVIKMVEKHKKLVIYGPPGTGKSQVIVNIISDYLAKGKKVLVVSEKRTALDVVYKRLSSVGIASKVCLVHDIQQDRQQVMNKFIESNLSAKNSGNYIKESVKEKSIEIQSCLDKFDKLAEELHKPREMGITLYNLYSKATRTMEIFDDLINKKEIINKYSYKELLNIRKRLEDIKKGLIYDDENSFLSRRTDFSEYTFMEVKKINIAITDFINLLERLEIETINKKLNQISKFIESIDIEKNIKRIQMFEQYENIDFHKEKYDIYKTKRFLSIFPWTNSWKLKEELKCKFNEVNMLKIGTNIEFLLKEKIRNKNIFEVLEDTAASYEKKIEILLKEVELSKEEKILLKEEKKILVEINEKIKDINSYFSGADYEYFSDVVKATILNLGENIEKNFEQIKRYDKLKNELLREHSNIFEHFKKNCSDTYLSKLENTFLNYWISEIERTMGDTLEALDQYDSLRDKVEKLMIEKRKLVPNKIENLINGKIKLLFEENKSNIEIGVISKIVKEAQKQRKKATLRSIFSEYKKGVFELIPCWLLTPEVVSEVLPLEKELFDLIIFDEASQIYVEKAIPAIYRGKEVVIAGDDKQLQPTSVGKSKITEEMDEDEDEEFWDDNDSFAKTEVSLLDLSKLRYHAEHLRYHYRSKYSELINFSNYGFYEKKLIIAPNNETPNKPVIEYINVNGVWEGRKNEQEAEEVYRIIKNILLTRNEKESIGIITFNSTQQDFIKDYFENISKSDLEFKVLYEAEKDRVENGEDKSIFIKNIENVQGDERDIILFSVAYSKGENGKVANRFGSLSTGGGENRLNVAISRAKKKMYIVTSLEPEDLRVDSASQGAKYLKKYLAYAKAVSCNSEELIQNSLNNVYREAMNDNLDEEQSDNFDSIFEEEVCKLLRERNYIVRTQIGDSGYRIDLGIYDNIKGEYILGIECDGATYHSTPSARERDIYRQKFLEGKGWKIHRIWSRNWWTNPTNELYKIEEKIRIINKN